MTVFNAFLRIVWKMKMSLMIYTAIFFLFSVLSATGAQKDQNEAFQNTPLNYEIVVTEKSELSDAFIAFLEKNNTVRIVENSEAQLREKVFIGQTDVAIILPADLEENVLAKQNPVVVITHDQKLHAKIALTSINAFFTFSQALLMDQTFSKDAILNVLDKQTSVTVVTNSNANFIPTGLTWSKYYFNAMAYVLLLIFISILGLTLSQFQQKNIFERQLISPLSNVKIGLQKFAGLIVVGFLITSMFIVGMFILKPSVLSSNILGMQILLIYVFMLCALAITFLITTLVGNLKFLYSGLANIISLGLALISGLFIPLEFLDPRIVAVAKFFPVYYLADGNQKILDGNPTVHINLLIICLFSIFYLLLALTFSKLIGTRRTAA